jgi:hypothetical protein
MLPRSGLSLLAAALLLLISQASADTAPLAKVVDAKELSIAGAWAGVYHYPDDALPPVRFNFKIEQQGDKITGKMKEPNTFGDPNEEFLYANARGSLDKAKRTVTYTKTYDGTGGISHDVEYSGKVSDNGMRIEGMWVIRQEGTDFSGRFTLEKLPPEEGK